MSDRRRATLYRMILADHECPFGARAKAMLEGAGFEIDEHILSTREKVDAFKAREGVATTPVTFIDGKRIDTSQALEQFLASASAD